MGNTEDELAELVHRCKADHNFAHKEVTSQDIGIEQAVQNKTPANITWVHDMTLYHPEDIPYEPDAIPKVFTNFRKQVEKKSEVRECYPVPESLPHTGIDDAGSVPNYTDVGLEEPADDQRGGGAISGRGRY